MIIFVNAIAGTIFGENLVHIGIRIGGGIRTPPLYHAPRTNATTLERQTCISAITIPKARECANLSHIALRIGGGYTGPPLHWRPEAKRYTFGAADVQFHKYWA